MDPLDTSEDVPTLPYRLHAYTAGQWATEAESAAAFDTAVDPELWRLHREVPGVLAQPRPQQPARTLRIDRVLVPTDRLINAGWQQGIIGCEIKRSGEKIGPPIAQAMDYSRAVWTLPGGFRVWLDWVFIWPMARQVGPIASVLAQNRIGSAESSEWDRLKLNSGGVNVIRVGWNGDICIGSATNGAKVGSR